MEAATVPGLVTALVETFADGLADYEAWKQKRLAVNHYRGRGFNSPPCALSTTLAIAGPQIHATYNKAVSLCGSDFTSNDYNCRSMLWSQLNVLSDRVSSLHRAASARSSAVVDLADATQVCEDVRRASLQALMDQYERVMSARPVPKGLGLTSGLASARAPVKPSPSGQSDDVLRAARHQKQHHHHQQQLSPPRYQMSLRHQQYRRQRPAQQQAQAQAQAQAQPHGHGHPSPPTDDDDEDENDNDDDCPRGFSREPSQTFHTQSAQPPSPPLTPKTSPLTSHNTDDSAASTTSSGPANSVFAQFCAEAMALQVNPKKPVPSSEVACPCGYGWRSHLREKRDVLPLKEGFKLTQRYLAKSHLGPAGFGCVLCTSTGNSGRYESVAELKEHINAAHTKWQLLHDADCRASSKLADGFW